MSDPSLPPVPTTGPAEVDPAADPYPPFRFAGREWRADKDWVKGTHRAMAPELTLARIRPHLHKAKVTRIGDVTGLDTLGVPVMTAVRPDSRTLAVESGKGATPVAAATSAAMEAIERFVAEEDPCVDVLGTVEDVRKRLAAPLESFPLNRGASVSPQLRFEWAEVTDLVSGRTGLVPSALMTMRQPPSWKTSMARQPWIASSNGLASGNHLPEALCAALYESIERDATSCWKVAIGRGTPALRIDLDSLRGEIITGLIAQLRERGADLRLTWCPTEIGIPTCMADLWDPTGGTGRYGGYGCHLDPEIAMIRAVTEAVQARTLIIAGSRDDIFREHHMLMRWSHQPGEPPEAGPVELVTVDDIPDRSTRSFHGDIAVLIDSLRRAGFDRVLARAFDADAFEVAVAKVFVPGLEPYHFAWTQPTNRSLTFDPVRARAVAS